MNGLHFATRRGAADSYANTPQFCGVFANSALRRRWCGHRDLNSDGVNHTPLKRTRLPVPPWPHSENSWPHSENSILLPSTFVNGFAGVLSRKYRGKTYVKVFCGKGERRGGTSHPGCAFRRLAQGGKRRKRKSRRRVPPTFFETRFTSWRCILQAP